MASGGAKPFGLVVTAEPDPADIALIEDNLSAFNAEAAALSDDRQSLCVLVKDDRGRTIGGATGHTRWGWLYVDCFWLPSHARKEGLGGRVLAQAEAEAATRGCTKSCLFTYSFQAQGFYERQGYQVFGAQEDYPPGHRKIWMRKEFAASR